MNALRYFGAAALVVLLSAQFATAQGPPCLPEYKSTTYLLPTLYLPPLPDSSMSPVAREAYADAERIYYSANPDSIFQCVEWTTTFDDTVKTMMRLYYAMIDHDPFLAHQLTDLPDLSDSSIRLGRHYRSILDLVARTSPTAALDDALLRSSFVMRVRIRSLRHDTTRGLGDELITIEANSTIVDTIKGKRLPECATNSVAPRRRSGDGVLRFTSFSSRLPDTLRTDRATPGHCFVFHYSRSWGVLDNWIEPGGEYIVFVNVVSVCRDEYGTYVSIRPIGQQTPAFRMFPVINDIVQTPGDELGIGTTSMHVADFTALLRTRIAEISQY